MSHPDDEIREPDDNLVPDTTGEESADEQPVLDSDLAPEAVQDGSLESDPSVGPEETGEATPPGDEPDMAAMPAGEPDETLEFAAPAEMESGIAFQSMEFGDEGTGEPEQVTGEEPPNAFVAGVDEFGAEKAEEELAKDHLEVAEEEEKGKKTAGERVQHILAAIGQSDPYTVLMGVALVALLCGILFFYLELSAYNFDLGAEKAKQLVGAIGFGWLH